MLAAFNGSWFKPLCDSRFLAFRGKTPLRFTTSPYCPSMVAVNVTGCPNTDGFWLEATDVDEVACVMLKLLLCVLLEPV
jgi:hypothetical protein